MDRRAAAIATFKKAILRYIARHPNATDTPEGIDQWWLEDVHPRPAPHDLQMALDELVREDKMTRTELVDGTVLFAGIDAVRGKEQQ